MPRDRLALVTGASSGIGYELARVLAREGFDLVVAARRRDKLSELCRRLHQEHGIKARPIEADLSEENSAARLFREATESGQEVDILVNNAAVGTFGPFAETSPANTRRMIRLNIEALTELTQLCLTGMLERDRGRILNVASTAAFQPGPLMAVYYASKAYVLHFSEALAEEIRGSRVTVTTLCPGPTRTEFQKQAEMEGTGLDRDAWKSDAETVARAGYRGMMRGKRIVVVGLPNKLTPLASRILPRRVMPRIVRALQAPRSS